MDTVVRSCSPKPAVMRFTLYGILFYLHGLLEYLLSRSRQLCFPWQAVDQAHPRLASRAIKRRLTVAWST